MKKVNQYFMILPITKKNQQGKIRIVIPVFDLYSKEFDDGTGNNHVTIFSYKIRT